MINVTVETDKYYTVVSAKGGMLQAVETTEKNGVLVNLGEEVQTDSRLWKFIPAGDNMYKLENKACGLVLDIVMAGISDGAWVHLWEKADAASQLWAVVSAGSNGIKLKSTLSGKVLDLVGGEDLAEIGAQTQIWQDVNGKRQLWTLCAETDATEIPPIEQQPKSSKNKNQPKSAKKEPTKKKTSGKKSNRKKK